MKKVTLLLPAMCLALIPFTAKAADPVLKLNTNTGQIGPYDMSLNPGGPLSLFCLNELNHIQAGESWTVDVINGANLATDNRTNGTIPGDGTLLQFEEEAYILSQYTGGPSSAQNTIDVQEALWKIFNPTETGLDTTATNWDTDAATFTYTSTFLSNYTFYIYDDGTVHDRDGDSAPQNFIGVNPLSTTATPEPSTLLMLGTGLTAMAGAVRRKLARA
jgi:hypothetical protein